MFESIGEGHKIMHEGPKKEIDLDELERLAAEATPWPWMVDMLYNIVDEHGILVHTFEEYGHTTKPSKANVRYITAACNALPALIAENRELRARGAELERQRKLMADGLELYCNYVHREDGDCPFWIECPNGRLCTGEVTDKMWIEFFEREAAKEAGE